MTPRDLTPPSCALALQRRAAAGERPGPGDQRHASGPERDPAAGPGPAAAAWGAGGAGGGQGRSPDDGLMARHDHARSHGKGSDNTLKHCTLMFLNPIGNPVSASLAGLHLTICI